MSVFTEDVLAIVAAPLFAQYMRDAPLVRPDQAIWSQRECARRALSHAAVLLEEADAKLWGEVLSKSKP